MAPSSQILVYYITPEGEPVSDVADFEVQLLHKEVSLYCSVYRTRLIKTSGGQKDPRVPSLLEKQQVLTVVCGFSGFSDGTAAPAMIPR